MEQERSAQHTGEKPSVPMTAASDFVVPEGTDELSRSTRRAWRDRLNDAQTRKMALGVLAAAAGGTFWGFSGTCASYLFDVCHIETFWLMSVRQVCAGLLFMLVVLRKDRDRLVKLWTTPADRKQLILFTIFGLLFNQICYLSAVRLTNAGTATVFQCLQLVVVMGYTCVTMHRLPRTRETLGILLALGGTFLIATGGDPSTLTISPMGLLAGLLCAVGGACMAVIPVRILKEYGSPVVTGSSMLSAGIVLSVFTQPWAHVPALEPSGVGALAVFIVVGSFFAYMFYMQGVKEIGSVRASLIGTMEPVSATITSALMLGTVFLPTDLAGFAMIIAMVFLTV